MNAMKALMLAVAIGLGVGASVRAESPPVKALPAPSEESLGTSGFAQSGDVKIHYVTRGKGPLLVMIHGFPDYWYTWRHQMPALS
jgi:hypothetical protein